MTAVLISLAVIVALFVTEMYLRRRDEKRRAKLLRDIFGETDESKVVRVFDKVQQKEVWPDELAEEFGILGVKNYFAYHYDEEGNSLVICDDSGDFNYLPEDRFEVM